MRELLQSNLDYVQFLFGLAFVPLAVQSYYLHRSGDRCVSWIRLCVFGAVSAAAGLAGLPAYALGDGPALRVAALFLLAVSGLSLLEFARASTASTTGRPLTLWVHAVPLVAMGLCGAVGGRAGVEIGISWVGVLGAGLWAAVVLWRAAPRPGGQLAVMMRLVSAAFAVYAALSVFAVPYGAVFPASVISHDALLRATGMPDQLLRLVPIALIAWLMGRIGRLLQPAKADRATMLVVHAAFPVLIVAGLVATNAFGDQGYVVFRRELVANATVAAALFEDAVHTTAPGAVTVDPTVAGRRLAILRSGNAGVGAVEVIPPGASESVFYDAGPSSEAAAEQQAEVGREAQAISRALDTGQVQLEGTSPGADPWITAYAPIYLADAKNPVAVVAMEISGADWQQAISRYRFAVIAATLFVALLTIAYYTSLRLQRLSADRVAASESRFRAIFENAPEAVFIVDATSTAIVAANPRMSELLGHTTEELLGMELLDLADPASIAEVFRPGADAATDGLRYRRADGTSVPVELTSASLTTDGRPGLVSFVRDVTEQRRDAAQLRHLADVERLIASVASRFVDARWADVGTVIESCLEEIARFCSADHAYHLMLADDAETVAVVREWWRPEVPRPARPVWTAIIRIPWVAGFYERQNHVRVDDTAELPEAAAEYRELLESQGVRSTLVAPTLSGGRSMGRLAIESVGRPVAWSEDIVSLLSALSVVLSNAVSRAEAEEQLERLSAAVELSPSAVIIADPDGCIEYVNAKFASGSGWTQEEVIGSPWLMLTQDSDEVTGRLQDAVATVDAGGEWHGEILLRRRGGTSFWASQAISAIRDDDGTVAHYFTLIEDISELKRIQDDLEQARREAVVASEAKSDFLASMSHEIRTPMNAIIGMGELLAGTGLDETQSRYARIMTSAGESLLNLVNGVLDLSKIEAGHLEFEERVFDLPDVFVRTCEVMEFQARTKGIELVTSIAAGVPRHVLGDPERLRQVLVNLIGNAVKFTESGTVTVSVGVTADDPGELVFRVEDTGIGIPADKLALVFERFTQGDSSTARRYGGTGLGLAISKALVELMGGTILVASEIGRGTTFTFTARMPEALAPTTAEAGPDRSRTDDDATRLLVAEDSDDNRLLVEHLLLDGPYELTFVGDGGAAVDVMTAAGPGGFDLVLMDIQMPVMDGLDATRAIREWESRQQVVETPIVALTAYVMKGDADRILEAGCTGRLSKPIRQAELIETIAIYARRGDHERR